MDIGHEYVACHCVVLKKNGIEHGDGFVNCARANCTSNCLLQTHTHRVHDTQSRASAALFLRLLSTTMTYVNELNNAFLCVLGWSGELRWRFWFRIWTKMRCNCCHQYFDISIMDETWISSLIRINAWTETDPFIIAFASLLTRFMTLVEQPKRQRKAKQRKDERIKKKQLFGLYTLSHWNTQADRNRHRHTCYHIDDCTILSNKPHNVFEF